MPKSDLRWQSPRLTMSAQDRLIVSLITLILMSGPRPMDIAFPHIAIVIQPRYTCCEEY